MTKDSSKDEQIIRVGLVQMCSSRIVADNLVDADRLIRQAAAEGAQYILTPETTELVELDHEIIMLEAQPMEHNVALAMFRSLARELKICLHIGSLVIKLENTDKVANRSILISPDGEIIAFYDKMHLFDVALPKGDDFRESDSYKAGDKAVVTQLPLAGDSQARVGFSICYDLRFPYLYRALAKAGANIITVPSAFTRQTGKAHWHVLLRARAIETGCFILAAAQGGRHDAGRSTYGHSLIISPWGKIIAEIDSDEPQILVADINLSAVKRARSVIPALTHDREFEITNGLM